MAFDLSYQPASGPSGGAEPGTIALRDYVLEEWPNGTRDMGIYNPRKIRGSSSWSIHSEGRGWDCGITPHGSAIGDDIAGWLIEHAAELGIQYFIWNRMSWSQSRGWTSSSSPRQR